jgi:flagellar basal-body rod modification protein FlgD
MTAISSALQSSVLASATGSGAGSPSAANTGSAATEDRFLKLLVTQLQNQDPLNPMDNSQLTSQMAQISTVSGIQQLNATVQSLSGQMGANQSVQAAGLVGHQVMVSGSSLALSGGSATGGFSLTQPVDQLTVTIRDAAGNLIHQVNLGPQQAGLQGFAWDGVADNGQQAVDGTYQFSLSALAAGKQISPTPLAVARVDAVRPASDGSVTLNLGGFGDAKLTDVQQIF